MKSPSLKNEIQNIEGNVSITLYSLEIKESVDGEGVIFINNWAWWIIICKWVNMYLGGPSLLLGNLNSLEIKESVDEEGVIFINNWAWWIIICKWVNMYLGGPSLLLGKLNGERLMD